MEAVGGLARDDTNFDRRDTTIADIQRSRITGPNGRTPSPDCRKCTAYRQAVHGGLPSALDLTVFGHDLPHGSEDEGAA